MSSKVPTKKTTIKRADLINLSVLVFIFYCLSLSVGFSQAKDPSIGITNNTGFNTNPDFLQRTIDYDKDLGIYKVRMGMDGVGGYNENDSFSWDARDAAVDKYIAEEFSMHCVIAARAHTNRYTSWEQWQKNYEYFCRNVMQHYKGKITYYIVDNEPDLGYGVPIGDAITPEQAVEFTKIAFNVAQSIDPNIKIESPPTMSPETSYLREMVRLGVTQYCHYLGVHAYGSQIDDGRLSKPWEYMMQFYNYPQRPVALSETGTNPNWHPAGMDGLAWQARWFEQLNVAVKRYGYDNVLLYRLDEGGAEWDILNKPAYTAIKNSYLNKPLTNGGFETTTDFLSPNEWMIIYGADLANPPTNITIVTSEKHGGASALNINGDGHVRQIVGALTPGVQVTVNAWVKASDGGSARLTLQGYNKTAGDAEIVVSSNSGEWTLLSATVTPSNAFLVAELESIGGVSFFDDVYTATAGEDEIYIASPANNTIFQFTDSTSIEILASVADIDNSITRVEFYADALKIGETLSRPFSYAWTSATEGNFAVSAKAYDINGILISSSAPVAISVKDPNVLKIPDLVVSNISWSPATVSNGSSVIFNATVKNQGIGNTKEGTVIGGAFLVNGNVVSWTDTYKTSLAPGDSVVINATGSPSGSNSWAAVSGYFTVEFKVDDINRIDETDENNNTLTNTLCVASLDGTPHVKINTPQNGTVVPLAQVIKIEVTAADCEGNIANVELFEGGTKVGEIVTAPYIFNWSTIKEEATLLKVVATDNEGKKSEASIQISGQLQATYEAENAVLTKALVKNRYGASGGKAVGSIDFDDSSLEFNVYVTKAGVYKVKIGYSNGMATQSSQNLYVNESTTPVALQYAPTNNWDTFSSLTIYTPLLAGRNKLTLKKGELFGEVDNINITFSDPNLIDFEAEDAIIINASVGAKSGASAGRYVGGIFDNSSIDFQIQSFKKGAFIAKIGYANGMGSPSSFLVRVNNESEYELILPPTENWDTFNFVVDTLQLNEGLNSIVFRKGNQYADLDYLKMEYIAPVDTQAPTVPANLTASTTSSTAFLNWLPSTDDGAVKYIIYKDELIIDTVAITRDTVRNLTVNTTYVFAVTAIDASGNESAKASLMVTTVDTDAPSQPMNLTGQSTDRSVSLNWSPSSDNVAIKHYAIYQGGEVIQTTQSNNIVVEALASATEYTFDVSAVDQVGNESLKSTITLTTITSTGTEDNLPGGGVVKIYPNPFVNQFKVELSGRTPSSPVFVSVFNLRGRLVADGKLVLVNDKYEALIDMPTQPSGVYLLVMKSRKLFFTKRIIKQ